MRLILMRIISASDYLSILQQQSLRAANDLASTPVPEGVSVCMRGPEKIIP